MGEVANSEYFHPDSSSTLIPSLIAKFKISMDTMLQGGRDVIIHLPPEKSQCPGSCRFNSAYKKFISATGGICSTCKGEGYLLEHRYTTYKANIRHIDMPLESADSGGQDTPAGRISQRVVRTKMALIAYTHLQKCLGATIDGEEYKLHGDLEKTGFAGTVLYVVATWKKMDK